MKLLSYIFEKEARIYGSLALVALLLYAVALPGPFFWDDLGLVVDNKHVTSFDILAWFTSDAREGAGVTYANTYRPLQLFLYSVLYMIFGLFSPAYHFLNIAIHSLSGFLVYKIFKQFNFKVLTSFLAALLFIAHPVQAESVSYISGLADVLSGFFVILGIFVFTNQNTSKKVVYTTLACLGALLSKEVGVVLAPLVALVMAAKWKDYSNEEKGVALRCLTATSMLTGIYILLRVTILNFTGELNMIAIESVYSENIIYRIYTFLASLIEYAKLILWPTDLYFDKPFIIRISIGSLVASGLGIVIAGLIGSWFSWKKKKIFAIAFLWFLIALAPVSGILAPANASYTEHWLYIPLVGILFMFAGLWESIPRNLKSIACGFFFVILILFSGLTIQRNTEWANPYKFFGNEIRHAPESFRVYAALGGVFYKDEAYLEAEKAYMDSIKKADGHEITQYYHYNLGLTYLKMNQGDLAIDQFFRALEINPNYVQPLFSLHSMAHELGDTQLSDDIAILMDRILGGESLTFEEIIEATN